MRVRGSGSITKLDSGPRSKCRHWRLRVQTSAGEKTRRFTGTYTQAAKALDEFLAEINRKTCDYTFGEYCDLWLEQRMRTDLDPSTLNGNRGQLKAARMEFEDDKIALMDRRRIEDGLANIQNGNNASKRKLSNTYMHKIHSTMSRMFKDAYIDDVLPSNPMDKVRAPRPDVAEHRTATPQDVARLIEWLSLAPYDAHTIAIKIAVLAGLRRSEVVGLEWKHYEGSTILVCQSIRAIDGQVKATKSRKMRRVPVMPVLAHDLDEWRKAQRNMLWFLGIEQTEDTPIITSDIGTRMAAQNLERWWRKNKSTYGVDCTLHELRHTFLTMLANSGAPAQVLKSVAGWSDISMANVYVHTDEDRNAEAVMALAAGTFVGTPAGTSDAVRNVP